MKPEATGFDRPASAVDMLVFPKTAAFRHDSIAAGIQAIRDLRAGVGGP